MGQIPKSPLIEAIFELRWGEESKGRFQYSNEETEFFPGIFSQKIKEYGYVVSEQIQREPGRPSFPFEVKYRFRKDKNAWPCFQIGLGVFTANQIGNASIGPIDKDEYDWDTFKPTIEQGLKALDSSYSSSIKKMTGLQAVLRNQDVFYLKDAGTIESFINEKIKADIRISDFFRDSSSINSNCKDIKLNFSYETKRPSGSLTLSFYSALVAGEPAILIDTSIASSIDSDCKDVDSLMNWAEEAHDIQRYVFNKLIKTSDL